MQSQDQPTKTIYRPRGRDTVRASFSMELEAQHKLGQIRDAFQTRFPKDVYPSLSAVLEIVIARSYADFLDDPTLLDAEVKEFQRRYHKK